jgi:tetratricopeptide (TPR) repeat protein
LSNASPTHESLARGVVAAEAGKITEGLALIRAHCAAHPGDAEGHAQLARWLSRLHLQVEANATAERALALQPQDARTLDTIGVVLSRGGLHERAVVCFERAVAREPGRPGFQFNLASSLKFLARFDEADRAYEACIAADPLHPRAHHALAHLRTQSPASNHLARLERLLAGPPPEVDAELTLRHAIAKELEDVGRTDEAFRHLAQGKARKRAACGYTFEQDRVTFEAVRHATSEPVPAPVGNPAPGGDDAPIFVVGLPRTGTTLVERILSSHCRVASAGESQNFGVLLKRAAGTRSARVLDAETMARAAQVELDAVGREYLARTRPPGAKPRFVDKLPLNVFYLGHIARALPEASLVVVRRHPLDTVVANYRQLFATGVRYYDYALDLADLAAYCVEFDRLVAHWRRVLPGRVHEVHYESLVTDLRATTMRLLEACRLSFEPACLEFERNPSASATASAVQVRSHLYATSLGRWRRFEAHLGPAIERLTAAGLDVR